MGKLTNSFFTRDTLEVAQDLIGKYLVRQTPKGRIIGKISENEAYIGRVDKACHAYDYKKTERNAALFQEGGIAYVYMIYGIHYCLNTVTETKGEPSGVLLRGVEIVDGYDIASQNRYGKPYEQLTKYQLKNFTNGPGKLTMAMDIDKRFNKRSLQGDSIYLCSEIDGFVSNNENIISSKRIGIDYSEEAQDFLWRFHL